MTYNQISDWKIRQSSRLLPKPSISTKVEGGGGGGSEKVDIITSKVIYHFI